MTTLTVQAQTPSGIRPNLPESRLESCVASTARLAGAVALSALATLFSLVLLPWQLALPISLGVAVILLVSEIPPHSYSERVYLTRSPPSYADPPPPYPLVPKNGPLDPLLPPRIHPRRRPAPPRDRRRRLPLPLSYRRPSIDLFAADPIRPSPTRFPRPDSGGA